ncbi:MAG: glycosyltransferase family 4 protein [Desulfobacterales bacterium]
MNSMAPWSHAPQVVLIGTYLPRQCGIATFTTDLLRALGQEMPEGRFWAVAMNDMTGGPTYPPEVRFEINQRVLAEYRLAADFLNMKRVDAVCLQHEYGIFGGEYGHYILDLLNALRMPLVTTLHTVLERPEPGQLTVLKRIARISDRLVVMSRRSVEVLERVYDVPGRKIAFIPHGIPDVPFVDPNYYKDQYGVEGRKVILTFGLLSPGKGIEIMIEALPAVVRRHPEVVYLVLGATHPHVLREQGESYRLGLQRRARELGVGDHVIFHNRFVELEELCQVLGAADIYVTPYLNPEQSTSGTLAYALGCGKAVVSTPYGYAEEMLAEGRGRLVPFRDPAALAAAILELLDHEKERHAMRKLAYTSCRNMVWREVARSYLELFAAVCGERERFPRPVFRARTAEEFPREAPQPRLDHILRLTDDVGILQHARYGIPDRRHGYCTDDNARALIAVLKAREMIADGAPLDDLAVRYLSFLQHAFNPEIGRFRNFMGYDRSWAEEVGSEESHGRAVWGLGEAIALAPAEDFAAAARTLFEAALPALERFTSPRAWAYAAAGLESYLKLFPGASEVRRLREALALKLFELYRAVSAPDWPWIEPLLAYANGRIAQALILGGRRLGHAEMLAAGLECLRWLFAVQTDPRGHLVPVGNKGWYPRGGERARFDQQPIEAAELIEAALEAWEATRASEWLQAAQRCLEWFLGGNDLNTPLYDHRTGGCYDGLTPTGPNRNQGAESTLVCFLSLLNLNQLRGREIADGEKEPEARRAQPGTERSHG